MNAMKTSAAVISLALGFPAQAQLFSAYAEGFEAPLPNPPRGENGSGGATFASFLLSTQAVPLTNPPAVAGLALALAGAGAMALRRRAR